MCYCITVTLDDSHEVEHVFTSLTVDEQSVLVPSDEAASQSWDQLRSELVELSDITRDLAKLVKVCCVCACVRACGYVHTHISLLGKSCKW